MDCSSERSRAEQLQLEHHSDWGGQSDGPPEAATATTNAGKRQGGCSTTEIIAECAALLGVSVREDQPLPEGDLRSIVVSVILVLSGRVERFKELYSEGRLPEGAMLDCLLLLSAATNAPDHNHVDSSFMDKFPECSSCRGQVEGVGAVRNHVRRDFWNR